MSTVDQIRNTIKKIPKRSELAKIYGPIVDGRWEDEGKHMGCAHIPVPARKVFGTGGLYCNKSMEYGLERALRMLYSKNLLKQLKSYDGCFIRGGSDGHEYGLAIILNAAEEKFSDGFLYCFRIAGFAYDGGHRFSWIRDD